MKKIIIGVLVIIEIFSLYMMYQSNENKKLNEVNIKDNKINKNTFAIYWDEKGTGTYTSYDKSNWPGEGYTLDFLKTECMSESGVKLNTDILAYNTNNNSMTVSSQETAYCTLYFKKCNGATGTVLDGKEQVTNCPVGGLYRYQGTDGVNNWICFGTSDKDTCTGDMDKYMYRIIGITPFGELKLIKETYVKEGDYESFSWNNQAAINDSYDLGSEYKCPNNGICPEWNESLLFKRLNGIINGHISGTGSVKDKGNTDIFLGNANYEYLNQNTQWYKFIEDHEWLYGDIAYPTSESSYNGDELYQIESGQQKVLKYTWDGQNKGTNENYIWQNKVTAKIGLMYIHDYLYAYPGGNPGTSDEALTSWIHYLKDDLNDTSKEGEWTMARRGDIYNYSWNAISAWFIRKNGQTKSDYGVAASNGIGVRPVFYLKNNVIISDTKGSKEDPFIITNYLVNEDV